MKKFLKSLFLIALAILFVPIVNAEELEYEWGKYIRDTNEISYTFIRDYGYDLFGSYGVVRTDKDGRIIDNVEFDDWYSFVGYDKESGNYITFCIRSYYDSGSYIYYLNVSVLNSDLEIIDEYEEQLDENIWFYPDYMNVTDTEYVFISSDSGETLVLDKDFSYWDFIAYDDLSNNELKELWGEYRIIDIAHSNSGLHRYYYRYDKNDKGYKLLQYDSMEKASGARAGLELYDENDELVYSKKYRNSFVSALSNDGFYVIEEIDIDDREDRELCNWDTECSSYNKLTKYDFNGKKIYEKDLQKMISDGSEYRWNEGRKITDVKYFDGSLLLISNYISTTFESLEEEITGYDSALIKYSIIYDIETKTDGNGEIKVVNSSKSGEEITYEIVSKEGYVLGVVKVTDKDGNVVEFTSNKFTMPNSDVTIEVTFLPKNPETKDLAITGIVIILAIGLGMLILNYRKLNFLK